MAKNIGLKGSFILSIVLHGVIVVAVILSVYISPPSLHTVDISSEQSEVDIIEAVVVDQQQIDQQIQRIQQEREQVLRAEEERLAALERRAREAEQLREREQQEARRVQEQRSKEEAEARAAAERRRKESERLEEVRRNTEKRIREQKAEEARLEAQRLQRLEEERRKEEAARQQAALEQQMREEAERQRDARAKERQSRVQSEVDRFKSLIQQTIQRHWLTDPSMRGKSCALRISIARDGFVTNVQVGEGDRAVCESARAAVLRAGSLPVSDDPDVYRELSNFTLRVQPSL